MSWLSTGDQSSASFDSVYTEDEMFRYAMLTCNHIFLPFLFPSFLRRQLLPARPILSSTNLSGKIFQDALSEFKPKMILLQFACIQWPMKSLLKDPGAGFFFPLRVVSFLPADGFGSLRNRFGTGFASCWATFFYRVVASFGRLALWS